MVAKTCALHSSLDPDRFGSVQNPEQRYEKFFQRLTTSSGASALSGSVRGVLLVAEEPQHLVGFIVATIEKETPIYRLEEYAVIHDIWVEPEYRTAGIGRQLVMHVIEDLMMIGVGANSSRHSSSERCIKTIIYILWFSGKCSRNASQHHAPMITIEI